MKKVLALGLSFSIVAVVFLVVIIGATGIIQASWNYGSGTILFPDLTNRCDYVKTSRIKENKIILRLDDVQAFQWRDISMRIIEDSAKKKAPIVLGVIPKGIKEDKKLYRYLQRSKCETEIAQHGWDHSVRSVEDVKLNEFENLSEDDAYERVMKGKKNLEKINGGALTTFIPPGNVYSSGAGDALKKAGFEIVSAQGNWQFDYSVSTYDFENRKLVPAKEVAEKCQESLLKKNICVIMLHPQDYAFENGLIDEDRYAEYTELLDRLDKMDASFVTMEEVYRSENKE